MTDPQTWHPPTGGEGDRPRYGEFAPPAQQAPPTGQPVRPPAGPPLAAPAGGGPTGWAPPPKPGLIPLRPLGFGTLLWAPFQVLRRNPKATFGSALIMQSGITLVSLVVVGLVSFLALSRVDSAVSSERDAVQAGAMLTIVLSALIPVALLVISSALLQGVIVVEVARATLGQKLRLGALWRAAGNRLWPLVLWSILLTGAQFVALALVVGGVVLFSVLGGAWIALAVVVGVLGTLALLAAGAWLGTKMSLVPSLIVLERLRIGQAVRRSWALTTGYFWRTLGVQFLVAAILNVVAQIVTTPLSLLFGVAVTLIDPNGSFDTLIPAVVLDVLVLFLTLVLGAVTAVIQSGTTALIYIDLRMRKEGLDLELQRFVESAQTGADVADPYLPVHGGDPGMPWA